MTPHEEGAAILLHYLRTISRAAGLRWSTANDTDIMRAAALLADGETTEIPPYQPAAATAPQRPQRRTAITPTTDAETDAEWMRRLAAANGVAPRRRA